MGATDTHADRIKQGIIIDPKPTTASHGAINTLYQSTQPTLQALDAVGRPDRRSISSEKRPESGSGQIRRPIRSDTCRAARLVHPSDGPSQRRERSLGRVHAYTQALGAPMHAHARTHAHTGGPGAVWSDFVGALFLIKSILGFVYPASR